MSKSQISVSVIKRLPRYYRFLGELLNEGIEKISSKELSERMNFTASQIRQDLNCFGRFGQQGYGYNVGELRREIADIIGVENMTPAIIIGAGNLGRAIACDADFEKRGCRLVGIFDINPDLENMEVAGRKVKLMKDLASFCRENQPKIAILCIPKSAAESVCEELITLGARGFWNFTHYDASHRFKNISVENAHLGDSLLTLVYKVNNS